MNPKLTCTALFVALHMLSASAQANDRIIVKFKDNANGRVQAFEDSRSNALSVMQTNTRDTHWVRASDNNTHIFRFAPKVAGDDRHAQLNRLRSDSRVEFAVIDKKVTSNAVSNDPFINDQWYLGTQATGAARFTTAWDQFRGSAGTVVAVIDTGVLPNHPELKNRLLAGYDFITLASIANDGSGRDNDASDPGNWINSQDKTSDEFKDCDLSNSSWHGTFVAGLVAGNTNDGIGTAGANWNARLLPIRALGKCGGYLSDVMDGARWAAGISIPGLPTNPTPAAIINLSLGSSGACSEFEQNAINQINARRAVVVAAAGNKAGRLDSPASCNGVIAVGALDADGRRASYSAVGERTTLMAPGGGDTAMVGPSNRGTEGPTENAYFLKRGTSFAAPMVSAALALVHGMRGSLNFNEAQDFLRRSARSFPTASGSDATCTEAYGNGKCACTTSVCGAGMLDAQALVTVARPTRVLANASSTDTSGGGWTLDSRLSTTTTGRAVVNHRWTQLSGPSLTLTPTGVPGQVRTSVASNTGEYIFQVTVEDSAGESHTVTVSRLVGTAQMASAPDNGSGNTNTGAGTGSDNETGAGNTGGSTGGTTGGATGGAVSAGGGALPANGVALLMAGLWLLRQSRKKVAKVPTGSRVERN